jgi:hypothetical protein
MWKQNIKNPLSTVQLLAYSMQSGLRGEISFHLHLALNHQIIFQAMCSDSSFAKRESLGHSTI